MAQVAAFVNTARSRVTGFLKAYDDINALANEYVALGAAAFVPSADPFWAGSDITQPEFLAALAALNAIRTTVATGNNARDLYKAKV